LRAELSPASLDEAETLMIAAGTPLFRLHRVRMLNDVPIAIDATEIPANLAPGVASVDFTTASLFQVLADANVQPVRADATIEAIEADEASAELLQLEIGKPLLVMKQLAIDNAERPLFSSTIRYAGDRYRLRTFFARNTGTSR
jgi:DNA-binding GntR family transcriptional regulator